MKHISFILEASQQPKQESNMTDTAPTSKACTKCGVVKLLGEFSKDKSKKNGLQATCKACASAALAKWRAANPEKVKAREAKRYAANPEKVKAALTKWHAANPEKVKAAEAKWRAANPEKVKAKCAKHIAEISDSYVASQIGAPTSKVPPEILAIKREAIAMRRISKQIKQFIKPKKAAP